jgi:hypothetical protein
MNLKNFKTRTEFGRQKIFANVIENEINSFVQLNKADAGTFIQTKSFKLIKDFLDDNINYYKDLLASSDNAEKDLFLKGIIKGQMEIKDMFIKIEKEVFK